MKILEERYRAFKKWVMKRIVGTLIWLAIFTIGLIIIAFSMSLFKKVDIDLQQLHYTLLIIFTFGIFAVAWSQLSGIRRTTKSDFLLRIDERYSSAEIMKARMLIHKITRATKKEFDDNQYRHKVAEKIKMLENDDVMNDEYIILMNFLDLLETIAYFTNKGHVSPRQIEELLGNSIISNVATRKQGGH